jgi:predicted amidophosphoribosyltransferase
VHAVTKDFVPDRRGNRLEHHEFLAVPGGRSHRLHLRGSAEIAEQFCQDRSGWCSYRPVLELSGGGEWWTHCLEAGGQGPGLPCAQLVDLLADVLSLPYLDGADLALALDWCKVTDDGCSWRDTMVGALVAAGKYRASHPDAVRAAATGLAWRMATVIGRHPLLGAADVIAPAPGHDRSILSFGEWVGREVAGAVGMRAVNVATRHAFRPPARDLGSGDGRVAAGEFFFAEDLTGCAVLVIDDVCQTGQTATATALAARRAGAARVYVLAGARTRRR